MARALSTFVPGDPGDFEALLADFNRAALTQLEGHEPFAGPIMAEAFLILARPPRWDWDRGTVRSGLLGQRLARLFEPAATPVAPSLRYIEGEYEGLLVNIWEWAA